LIATLEISEEAAITFTSQVDIHLAYSITINGKSRVGTTSLSETIVLGTIKFSYGNGEIIWLEYNFPIYEVVLVKY